MYKTQIIQTHTRNQSNLHVLHKCSAILLKSCKYSSANKISTADGQTDCKNVSKNSIHEIDADISKKPDKSDIQMTQKLIL